jgi:hypothetical protein
MKKVAILLPTMKKFVMTLPDTLAQLNKKTLYQDVGVFVFYDADPVGFRNLDSSEYKMRVAGITNDRIVERVGAINRLYKGLDSKVDLYLTWMPDADPWEKGWLTKAVDLFDEKFGRGAGLLELRGEIIMFNKKFIRVMDLPENTCIPPNYIRYNWDRELIDRAKIMEIYAKGKGPRRQPEEISQIRDTHIRVNDNVVFNRRERNWLMAEATNNE